MNTSESTNVVPMDQPDINDSPMTSDISAEQELSSTETQETELFKTVEEALLSADSHSTNVKDLSLSMQAIIEISEQSLTLKKNHVATGLIKYCLSQPRPYELDADFFNVAAKTYNLARLSDEAEALLSVL